MKPFFIVTSLALLEPIFYGFSLDIPANESSFSASYFFSKSFILVGGIRIFV